MPSVDQGSFSCKQCGKSYKWKPDFAGKKVKCKCGYVMTAPKAAPVPEESDAGPDLDALYDLADAGERAAAAAPASIRCPSRFADMEPGAQVCEACGFNLKTGSKKKAAKVGGGAAVAAGGGGGGAAVAAAPNNPFAAFGQARKGLQQDVVKDDNTRDLYVPLALIVGGLAVTVLQLSKFNARVLTVPDALMVTFVGAIISMVLIAVGCYFGMKWADMAFGSPGPAALKIAAIAIGPSSLASIISYLLKDPFGIVGAFLAFGMFFALFNYLFDLDTSDIWILTLLVTAVRMFAAGAITMALLGGIGMHQFLPKKAEATDDAYVTARLDMGRSQEADAWLKDSTGRLFGELPRGAGVDITKDLYALGAKQLMVTPDGPNAAELLIEMPKDAKRRTKIVEAYNEWAKQYKVADIKDTGGKWVVARYLPIEAPPTLDF